MATTAFGVRKSTAITKLTRSVPARKHRTPQGAWPTETERFSHEAIARVAYELYERRGGAHGDD